MRVCLINPPRIQPKNWGKPSAYQPLDIAYVAAVLEKHHAVCVIDAPTEGWRTLVEIDDKRYRLGLTNAEIAGKIKRWQPRVVVITVPFSGWWETAFEVASSAKSVDKDIVTVLMGLDPSARPADCLAHRCIDFVVIGEPEQTVFELASLLEQGKAEEVEKVRGIAFVKNGETIITQPRPLLQDLDSLPFPARHLLPMQLYFAAVKENPLRGEICKPWAIVITSRGCPYSCVFCTSHTVMGRRWRARSPENVVDELEHLVRVYRVKQIDFLDDNLTLDKKRMEAICDLIVKRGLKIEWFTPSGVRADTLDEPLLRKMKQAGCRKIRLAPESGVQRVVNDIIKKNLSLEAVEKAVFLCKKVGIRVGCFFVIGLIGETKQDIEETIKFAYKLRRLGAEGFIFSIATPQYGTELYEQAKRGGFLRANFSYEALSAAEPLIETPEFTADELRELCARANLVNPTFTRAKVVKAIRDPMKALKVLLGKK
ncbi:MAG: B12-binding domain-containing radical SAM protein [Candidatus Bathyarchaeota archaeon]|nr:B12-binding domain-containing radical SAM protein [Candidatus Bathyarchaeota archaeon]